MTGAILWHRVFDYGATIAGTVRSLYTDFINGKYYTVLGSNEKIYSLIGSRLTNITPLLNFSMFFDEVYVLTYGVFRYSTVHAG